MTAKEYLSRIPKLNRLISQLFETVKSMKRDLVRFPSATDPDKVSVSSGPKDPVAASVAQLVDLEREFCRYIEELSQHKKTAYRIIRQLPDLDWQMVLLGRYFQEKSWQEIAQAANHQERWAKRKHEQALNAFQKEFEKACPEMSQNVLPRGLNVRSDSDTIKP